ncbi:MAG: hypothetical protein ACRELE_05940 [Gemmatimonadales bacterium]
MKRLILVGGTCAMIACGPGRSALPPVRFISPPEADQRLPRFSPDGTRLFWWDLAAQAYQLWTGPADLHDSTKVPVTSLVLSPLLWSPDGTRIAVSSSEGGISSVAVIPAAGGAPRRLTDSAGFAQPTGWNPDGDRLSYVATSSGVGGGTFQSLVTSVSRGGSTPLLPGESRFVYGVWSPDGRHIVYQVVDSGRNTIWVADSAGGSRRQLTADGFERIGTGNGPTDQIWSPDSREIVYESQRTGTFDIWVVPADSGSPRQLTNDVRNDDSPIWSPDGRWIAFRSDRGKQTDLWLVPAAGGVEQRVTNERAEEEPEQWLKGTNELVYLTGEAQSGIWAMSVTDTTARRLTPDSIRASAPQISPDGKQILFGINHGGGFDDLAVMPITGGAWRVLVQGGSNTAAAWSPDGKLIAFQSDRGGSPDIWVVDAAGGAPRQLVNWPGADITPVWNADSKSIDFVSDHQSRLADVWRVAASGGEPVRLTTNGAVNGVTATPGRPEIYVAVLESNGQFVTEQLNPDGSLRKLTDRGNTFPIMHLPTSDSMIVAETEHGGAFSFRIIPDNGRGEGQAILQTGQFVNDVSRDGTQLLYVLPNGSANNLVLLDRRTGTTRRLTTNTANENGASFTPDGRAIVFQRSHQVRRIAIADLTQLLARTPH